MGNVIQRRGFYISLKMGNVIQGRRFYVSLKITITIYFINPSGKLKLSFDRTTKNISQIMNHTHMMAHVIQGRRFYIIAPW